MRRAFQRQVGTSARRNGRTGQSVIESCIVVALISLLLFGLLQLSHLFMSQEVLDYAAFCAARARAVGFNDFMVQKAVRVACIPVAGPMTTPSMDSTANPMWQTENIGWLWSNAVANSSGSAQFTIEQSRIPLYLGGNSWGELPGILDYESWSTVNTPTLQEDGFTVQAQTGQDAPLLFPFHRAFFAADDINLKGQATVESHYPLYLQ